MITLNSFSPQQTYDYGKKLTPFLKAGDVIALYGELGTGKTVLSKGIANGLRVKENITSPTFTIIREYKGKMPLFHFDVYRINENDLLDLGYEDYFYSDGVTIIEWAERVQGLLPVDYLAITLSYGKKESDRLIEFRGIGKWQIRIKKITSLLF